MSTSPAPIEFIEPMRVCKKCLVPQPDENFYIKTERNLAIARGRTRVRLYCRSCTKKTRDARFADKREYVDKIKREGECADCGLKPKYTQVLEFDHRPGEEKLAHIANMVVSAPMEVLQAEIAKCDLVCANCHRVRSVEAGVYGSSFGVGREGQHKRHFRLSLVEPIASEPEPEDEAPALF